ncbi:hypothetical protein [Streptomyces syringium]|uniref:hypothetical protein n=1 Tax=Streptomyces syringium TaxID=76729 RepID=UPI0033F89D08
MTYMLVVDMAATHRPLRRIVSTVGLRAHAAEVRPERDEPSAETGDQLLQAGHELDAAHRMQAAFATNTTIGVRVISAIDGTPFPTMSVKP